MTLKKSHFHGHSLSKERYIQHVHILAKCETYNQVFRTFMCTYVKREV